MLRSKAQIKDLKTGARSRRPHRALSGQLLLQHSVTPGGHGIREESKTPGICCPTVVLLYLSPSCCRTLFELGGVEAGGEFFNVSRRLDWSRGSALPPLPSTECADIERPGMVGPDGSLIWREPGTRGGALHLQIKVALRCFCTCVVHFYSDLCCTADCSLHKDV